LAKHLARIEARQRNRDVPQGGNMNEKAEASRSGVLEPGCAAFFVFEEENSNEHK